MGQIMKKNLFLSLYLLCSTSLTVCSAAYAQASNSTPVSDDDYIIIDTTSSAKGRCGVDGISCNDTPLVNYTKTEANFRKNVERTKRDHLYTQAAAGNNLSATVRPTVENDIVVANIEDVADEHAEAQQLVKMDDGIFSNTGSLDIETHVEEHLDPAVEVSDTPVGVLPLKPQIEEEKEVPTVAVAANVDIEEVEEAKEASEIKPVENIVKDAVDNEVGKADNINTVKKVVIKTVTEEDGTIYEILCQDEACTKVDQIKQILKDDDSEYEIICEENCEDIMIANADDDVIKSEFTEESFDIADYVDAENEDTAVEFYEVGSKETLVANVSVKETKITDETILTWEAEEGNTLRELLTKWSAMAGWKLLWNTNRNYTLSAGVMFKGNFADVSSALIRAFARARPAPIATYYKGNRVIVVETMENENAY